ncbi:type II toxin-antitoxin system Phd/YefM family antitoxin [Cupriavidus respiraculi]|uniref:Antitoxin n=1 Tax=Cupriavidus respiraculi TaxID=195930 RepID=A0ABN7YJE1_9BURK|nr:type II toxin-antitoxin system Phd/YefM family antitoxin [Cupriavidus respiraculi]MBY4945642.1 type II toxin-antitoxin system Phd/YefM family antitoxin [Cupriavidus respiraculi]CAG9173589.1 hypothetical protein LMG21510_02306 [Cupriavidus respiraculi]
MSTVNLQKAQSELPSLVDAVVRGTEAEVIIEGRDGAPAAVLLAFSPALRAALHHLTAAPALREPAAAPPEGKRRLGVAAGKYRIPADIDRANEDIRRMFEGESD